MSNILIVDDSQVERTRLKSLLSKEGYRASTAENGALGIEAAKKDLPDLILMDVNMPELDGFAATRALRNDETTKDIPVVLVSVKNQKADKAWGKMLGAKGYITKPYTDEEMLSVIKSL
ncbi:MAG: two-component system response regulator [Gammaproteobacteria bacterium]|nr:MAG: two-component system response regulator [Gammaproteobacteria bacterium]